MRLDISSADSPPQFQTIATTGMLMLGKMSVGVRAIVNGPTIRISRARTTNVYGRRRATRTIHIAPMILTLAWGRIPLCHGLSRAPARSRSVGADPAPVLPGYVLDILLRNPFGGGKPHMTFQ